MPLKTINSLLLVYIKNPYLPLGIPYSNFVIIAERYRADVIVELRCLVDPGYLGGTA